MRVLIVFTFLTMFAVVNVFAQSSYEKKRIKISYDKHGKHYVIEEDFYGDIPDHIQDQLDDLETSKVKNFQMDIIEYDNDGGEAKSVHVQTDDDKNELSIATKEKGKDDFTMNSSFEEDENFKINFSSENGEDVQMSWDKGKLVIENSKGKEEVLDLTSIHEFVTDLIEDSGEYSSGEYHAQGDDDHQKSDFYKSYQSDDEVEEAKTNHSQTSVDKISDYDDNGLKRIKASKKSFGEELTIVSVTSSKEGLQVSFSFDNKTPTIINLYSPSGVAYYSEEVRVFTGAYETIIPYNMKSGTYTLSIEQGDKAYFREVVIPAE